MLMLHHNGQLLLYNQVTKTRCVNHAEETFLRVALPGLAQKHNQVAESKEGTLPAGSGVCHDTKTYDA
jgi:hypothetical protein